jgi:mRNA-degrading endonuclease RelE of RelBE toxin-antitoxin system
MRSRAYNLLYAPATRTHLRAIEAKYYSLIRQTIEQQLTFQPDTPTRNRKPLKRTVLFGVEEATWELRFGPSNMFRVFYTLFADENTVAILAIGIKKGNRLVIADEEIVL